jgi:hypothetical protein
MEGGGYIIFWDRSGYICHHFLKVLLVGVEIGINLTVMSVHTIADVFRLFKMQNTGFSDLGQKKGAFIFMGRTLPKAQ